MYTSQKMPLYTSKEQKVETHQFLLFPNTLFSYKVNISGRGQAGSGSCGGRRESKQIFEPSSSALVDVD